MRGVGGVCAVRGGWGGAGECNSTREVEENLPPFFLLDSFDHSPRCAPDLKDCRSSLFFISSRGKLFFVLFQTF